VSKKNSKKNKLKSKDRFRNSIIANENIELSNNEKVEVNENLSATPSSISVSVSSTKFQLLGSELKLIGIIGFSLFAILIISSFVI
tara:strand:- start:277 stop:534 length:258 start_codon:yes stop_codon:yes gene_type:complete